MSVTPARRCTPRPYAAAPAAGSLAGAGVVVLGARPRPAVLRRLRAEGADVVAVARVAEVADAARGLGRLDVLVLTGPAADRPDACASARDAVAATDAALPPRERRVPARVVLADVSRTAGEPAAGASYDGLTAAGTAVLDVAALPVGCDVAGLAPAEVAALVLLLATAPVSPATTTYPWGTR